MSHGDSATVQIDLLIRDTDLVDREYRLTGECLVDLIKVYLLQKTTIISEKV